MRGIFGLATATVAAFLAGSLARPLVVNPGGVEDIVITEHNTINSTSTIKAIQQNNPLQLEIVNNFGSNQMYLYVTGTDRNGVACMLGADGNFYYPDSGGSGVPIPIHANVATTLGGMGSTTTVILPDSLRSSRIWVAEGQLQFYTVLSGDGKSVIVEPSVANPDDPSANIKWGFVEFNWENGEIFANVSFVDWVGISMGMGLTLGSGEVQTVQGLVPGAVEKICNDLREQNSRDGAGWDHLCMSNPNGEILRVLSSNLYLASNPTWQSNYYTSYVDQVWQKYTNEDLIIDTQHDAGEVACRVNGDWLYCNGDSRGYPKPTVADIYGCNSGPFTVLGQDNNVHRAVVPRLCAAFTRSTLLLDGGNKQPSLPMKSYYTADPTNHYSRIVHNYEQDGLGYAFSYDDVNPSGENAAGTVAGRDPKVLKVTAGGWS